MFLKERMLSETRKQPEPNPNQPEPKHKQPIPKHKQPIPTTSKNMHKLYLGHWGWGIVGLPWIYSSTEAPFTIEDIDGHFSDDNYDQDIDKWFIENTTLGQNKEWLSLDVKVRYLLLNEFDKVLGDKWQRERRYRM